MTKIQDKQYPPKCLQVTLNLTFKYIKHRNKRSTNIHAISPSKIATTEQLMNVIEKNWIKKVFDPQKFLPMQNKRQNKIFAAKYTVCAAFMKMKDNSKLKTRLAEAIHEVMEEKNNLSMREDDNLIHI